MMSMQPMDRQQPVVENHPLKPFFPEGARVLMLGSFPPKRERWKMEFYYPNFQNDMWRIFGEVFFRDKDYFLAPGGKAFREEAIRDFLTAKGIALSDTGYKVIRLKDNASDKFLEIVEPIDLHRTLRLLPACEAIVTTSQKATDTLLSLISAEAPKVGTCTCFEYDGRQMRFYRMPSSSRAYPKPLVEKAEDYRRMFAALGMLP